MISMDLADGNIVDLERGAITEEYDRSGAKIVKNTIVRVCNGPSMAEEPVAGPPEGEEVLDLAEKSLRGEDETLDLAEKKTEVEKTKKKKKGGRKPPKPPRPPRAVSLEPTDQKVIQQISELAMMKRARIERMKALMKMKNSRPASLSSNFWPLIITVLFCIIIVWQGFSSRSHQRSSFAGSPESSIGNGRMIQVQFLRNAFPSESNSPVSDSPSIMENSMNRR